MKWSEWLSKENKLGSPLEIAIMSCLPGAAITMPWLVYTVEKNKENNNQRRIK